MNRLEPDLFSQHRTFALELRADPGADVIQRARDNPNTRNVAGARRSWCPN
jgi:hypothetical protein